MSVSRLRFNASFINSSTLRPLFYLKVWREGNDPNKHDQQLVDELNQHGLKSNLVTSSAGIGCRNELGQSCFGGGYYQLSFKYTAQELNSALAKLNSMTAQEVATHWNVSGPDINIFYSYLQQLEPTKSQANRLLK